MAPTGVSLGRGEWLPLGVAGGVQKRAWSFAASPLAIHLASQPVPSCQEPERLIAVRRVWLISLYLFFFLGVRVGVLPLEEVDSQFPLAPKACDTPVPTPLLLLAFFIHGGSKSGGAGRMPAGLPKSHPRMMA